MSSRERLQKHAALYDDMASACGVDLEEAALRGAITPDEIADGVLACTGCSNPEECRQWLDARQEPAQATPSYCRNSESISALRQN